jgi:acetylornithine deacetylase/succinyl-diaminopimelate desuccinylase family protein
MRSKRSPVADEQPASCLGPVVQGTKFTMIDASRVTEILTNLVRIDSVNSDLVPGGRGEEQAARYVADFLGAAGLTVRLEEIAVGRWNVIGVLRGRGKGRSLMLNGHLDTVGVEGMAEPFSARIEDGRLYGRGAQDMKGGLAAALAASEMLADGERLQGDLVIAGVADEEYKSAGTRALLRSVRTDAAIVMEPTGLEVATAHKGFTWADVETLGRAAHGSRPKEGVDAIALMGRVLVEIENLQAELGSRPGHSLLGCGSVHASLISGGQELSSYPEKCHLSLERRLIPGEDADTFESELAAIVSRLKARAPGFKAKVEMGYSAAAMETSRESAIAKSLLSASQKVVGPSAKFGAQTFWTDAALLNEAGIPSVLFGPGGEGLHSKAEFVNLQDVGLCAETLAECARAFCGAHEG